MGNHNLKIEIIKTLYWINEMGLHPEHPDSKDRYYCPVLDKIFPYRSLNEHQKRTALWIPNTRNVSHLRDVLADFETGTLKLIRVKVAGITATGCGDEEAMINVFTKIRGLYCDYHQAQASVPK